MDTYYSSIYIYHMLSCWAWQPQTSNWGRSVTNAGFGQQLGIQPSYLDSQQRGNKNSQSWRSFSLEVQYAICSIYGTVVTREKANIMITIFFVCFQRYHAKKNTQQLITTTYGSNLRIIDQQTWDIVINKCAREGGTFWHHQFGFDAKKRKVPPTFVSKIGIGEWHQEKHTNSRFEDPGDTRKDGVHCKYQISDKHVISATTHICLFFFHVLGKCRLDVC